MRGRFRSVLLGGLLSVIVTGLLAVLPAFAAAPTVSVTPSQVARGGTLQVSGSGYIPKFTVLIYVNGSDWHSVFSTRADANGAIADTSGKGAYYPLKIDCGVPPGDYTLFAASYDPDSSASQIAKTTFTVTSDSIGACKKNPGPPPEPTAVPTLSQQSHNLWKLGFNLSVKPNSATYGRKVAVVIDTHWPSVFKGSVSILYDKKHHVTAKIRTNKKGAVTYHFKVTYHASKTTKSRVVVTLSGTVLGQKMKGVQSAPFTIRAH